jgi:hypothetical protein
MQRKCFVFVELLPGVLPKKVSSAWWGGGGGSHPIPES